MAAAPARASGFSVARFSGEHGNPTTDNPTALYFNPGALRAERQVFVDGLVGVRRMTYTRTQQPTDAPDPDSVAANTGRATLTNFHFNPSLWLAIPVSHRLSFGAGVYTPFGGPIRWDHRQSYESSPYPGPFDGVTRFHAMEGLLISSYGSLGASYRVGDSGLRLGAAFNAIYSRIDDIRAYSGGSNALVGEGRSLVEVDGWSFGFGVGAFWQNDDHRLKLGLAYQSRPGVTGDIKLGGKLTNDLGGVSTADVQLHQGLPDVVRFGIAYRPEPMLELRAFAAWERWSAFARQCVARTGAPCTLLPNGGQAEGGAVLQNVPRDFHDAIDARLGLSGDVSRSVEVVSGIGVMSSAVPKSTLEAGLPDFWGVTFTLGLKARVSDALSVGGSLSHIVSPARDADSKLQNDASPSRLPSASGHYTQDITYIDLNVAMRF